jgi:hypothetical protein
MSICMLVAAMSIPRDRRRTVVFRSDQGATGIDAVLPLTRTIVGVHPRRFGMR